MERLFSYGTLQMESVQKELFGRVLDGVKDTLIGYVLAELKITDKEVINKSGKDRHPILKATKNCHDAVEGTLLELTPEELLLADDYEVEDYVRVKLEFVSGLKAWVYVEANPDARAQST